MLLLYGMDGPHQDHQQTASVDLPSLLNMLSPATKVAFHHYDTMKSVT